MVSFFTQRCDIRRARPVENDRGRVTYEWDVISGLESLSCRYDPRRVRSHEDVGEASRSEIDMVTFFTEYPDVPVTNDMVIIFEEQVFRIQYINQMRGSAGNHHLEIITYRAANL